MNTATIARCTVRSSPIDRLEKHTHLGICRGSLGELFQGPSFHCDDEIVIISALIRQHSAVRLTAAEQNVPVELAGRLQIDQVSHPKAFKALDLFCALKGVEVPGGVWSIESGLAVGRGMASSTADIVAIVRCAASYHGLEVSVAELIQILSEIERSDSVFLDQLALFCSSRHQVIQVFDRLPTLYAAYFHEPDVVDTEGSKASLLAHYQDYRSSYHSLYQYTLQAFGNRDRQGICQASTRSSQLGQYVIQKPHFVELHNRMHQFKADGVITAHTGSVLGYLFCRHPDRRLLEFLCTFFANLGGQCRLAEIG